MNILVSTSSLRSEDNIIKEYSFLKGIITETLLEGYITIEYKSLEEAIRLLYARTGYPIIVNRISDHWHLEIYDGYRE